MLAAYNGSAWIKEQIYSILGQGNVDLNLIVRDDESTDATIDLVSELAGSDPRIRLVRAGTASGSASQNFFALIRTCTVADFDFVALSDQDDIWASDKLERASKFLNLTSSYGYSSAVLAEWPHGKARILRQKAVPTESDFLFEGAGQGCTFALNNAFYAKLQHFLQDHEELTYSIHYHDWAIYALARAWGGTWIFDQQPTIRYRQHQGNDTGARSGLKGLWTRLKKIRTGWYRTQLVHIAKLCHSAAPHNETITRWHSLLNSKPSLMRRCRIAFYCAKNGRRRHIDTLILVMSSLAGWL